MQDRYAGDIGDFFKLGLLRSLTSASALSLGVIWFRIPSDVLGNDGHFVGYLRDKLAFRACDPELYDALGKLVERGKRSIAAIERASLLQPGTLYFSPTCPGESKHPPSRRWELRRKWFAKGVARLLGRDLIFLDPDNGLEISSVRRGSLSSRKYVFYEELDQLCQAGHSIVIYQHLCRKGTAIHQIQRRLVDLQNRPKIGDAFALRFHRGSGRAFLVAAQANHRDNLRRSIELFLNSPWGDHASLVEHPTGRSFQERVARDALLKRQEEMLG
jgi:hypothetical protein